MTNNGLKKRLERLERLELEKQRANGPDPLEKSWEAFRELALGYLSAGMIGITGGRVASLGCDLDQARAYLIAMGLQYAAPIAAKASPEELRAWLDKNPNPPQPEGGSNWLLALKAITEVPK